MSLGKYIQQFDTSTPRREFLRAVATGTMLAALNPLVKKFDDLTPNQASEFKAMFGFPKTAQASKWSYEQKREYATQALQDYYFMGPQGLIGRKWWYEHVREIAKPQQYNISCEFTAIQILLLSKGITNLRNGLPVTEDNLISIIPTSNNPLEGRPADMNAKWGNTPPYPYGINPRTLGMYVKNYLNQNIYVEDFTSIPTINTKQHYLERLQTMMPCAVWFQMDTAMGKSSYYPSELGGGTIVAPGEHCAIAIAMDEDKKNILLGNTDLNVYRAEVNGPNGFFERSLATGLGMMAIEN